MLERVASGEWRGRQCFGVSVFRCFGVGKSGEWRVARKKVFWCFGGQAVEGESCEMLFLAFDSQLSTRPSHPVRSSVLPASPLVSLLWRDLAPSLESPSG